MHYLSGGVVVDRRCRVHLEGLSSARIQQRAWRWRVGQSSWRTSTRHSRDHRIQLRCAERGAIGDAYWIGPSNRLVDLVDCGSCRGRGRGRGQHIITRRASA